MNLYEMNKKCRELKLETLKMCVNAGYGHVTSAFSCTEILVALYYDLMNVDRNNPKWEDRDRFVLSKNHAADMLYPIFVDFGWIDSSELKNFGKDDVVIGSHSKLTIPGVEFTGGALGIGFGAACGMAYAAKCDGKTWKTYCVIGDGESYEGSIWESAMFAGHNRLSNLTVLVDRNHMCMINFTEEVLGQDPLEDKWRSFGWYVDRIDGHDIAAIIESVHKAEQRNLDGKPVCIICDTIKGHGVDFMENNRYMHGLSPRGEKAQRALAQLGGVDNE